MQAPRQDFTAQRMRIDQSSAPEQAEWFRDVFAREVVKLDFEPREDAPLVFDSTVRQLPDVAITRVLLSPMVCRRRRQENDDSVILFSIRSGATTLINERQTHLSTGSASFARHDTADADAAMAMESDTTIFGVRLSRRLLSPRVSDYGALRRQIVAPDNEALRLLVAYVEALEREDEITGVEVQRAAAAHIADLAALVIGASRDGAAIAAASGVRSARLAAVKRDIADNIARPDLSEAAVAARHRISPRYLRRLFETEGTTFTGHVLAERLERAFRALSDPKQESRTIGEIGLASGFGDLSYFNRTFRRRYGDTPSGVRSALRRRS